MTRHLTQSSLFRFIYKHKYIYISEYIETYDVEKSNWAGEEKSNERWIAPLSNFKYTCILWYIHNNRDKEINIALYPSTSFISLTTIQPCRHVSLILSLFFLLFSWRTALKYFSHSILHSCLCFVVHCTIIVNVVKTIGFGFVVRAKKANELLYCRERKNSLWRR